uniref:Uncharacterized protein n=1 Tax=Anguilla anguilla TaxID=7936 RepID=A0A0E9SXS6_ANGAN
MKYTAVPFAGCRETPQLIIAIDWYYRCMEDQTFKNNK